MGKTRSTGWAWFTDWSDPYARMRCSPIFATSKEADEWYEANNDSGDDINVWDMALREVAS